MRIKVLQVILWIGVLLTILPFIWFGLEDMERLFMITLGLGLVVVHYYVLLFDLFIPHYQEDDILDSDF